MNYLDLIKSEIQKALKNLSLENINFSVDIPELEHGDVTSNFCLVASKVLKMSPAEVFGKIEPLLTSPMNRGGISKLIEKIEFKNPGFVNFYLKSEYINSCLNPKQPWWNFWKGESKNFSKKYLGKKVLVEHTQPNLFKPFTVGHLMNNFTGEYIVRVLREVGAKVISLSYPSDISIGIAKAVWCIKQDGGLEQEIFNKEKREIVKYFGQCYVRGVSEYKKFEEENNLEKIREIKDIANNLFGNIDSVDLKIFDKCKKINLDYIFSSMKNLGSDFDNMFFESESAVIGKQIVLENTGVGKVFQLSEGAIVYIPSEERKDINTTVFINSENNPTYAGKDIGLLDLKFKKYNPDYSIYVTDNEQIPHFKVVLDAAGRIHSSWEDRSLHVSHGRMTFKGQKMSSRLGGVPSAEEVIEAVVEDVMEKSDEKIQGMNLEEKEKLQREIALSALRISILRSKPGVNIDFDPERASSFEGDSGPYLCYTHARCASLLEKGEVQGQLPRPCSSTCDSPTSKEGELYVPTRIERKVLQFENVIKISAEEIAPQKLVKYLFELAGEFNSFYADTKILDEKDSDKTEYNLYLTKITKDTLKKGLYILGIQAPEKM